MTISYWSDMDQMRTFAGDDPNAAHHLPRDGEFLVELPKAIQILRLLTAHEATGSS